MRSKFDEQMDELNNQMINMGTMIERSIAKAVEALTKKNSVLAKEVTAEDERQAAEADREYVLQPADTAAAGGKGSAYNNGSNEDCY